ncbi:hypothetical protein E4U53_005939 [Claviceps sorghi]|nr:hypothetical protein E4U53_005939 [Claviceps sorghi]
MGGLASRFWAGIVIRTTVYRHTKAGIVAVFCANNPASRQGRAGTARKPLASIARDARRVKTMESTNNDEKTMTDKNETESQEELSEGGKRMVGTKREIHLPRKGSNFQPPD